MPGRWCLHHQCRGRETRVQRRGPHFLNCFHHFRDARCNYAGRFSFLQLLHRHHADDFLQRRLPGHHPLHRVQPHRLHPLLHRHVLKRARG